jgi:glyoxylase-like metal-dependent hydrolase (beta-lactamase superfamily II)
LAGHEVRALWTPGHTPGHLCFLLARDGLLVSGDHVLPRVSPNVSSYDHSDRDPLGDFLHSLTSLVGLGVTEVLPAHEYRFADLEGRVDELQRHHDERLALIEALLRERGASSSWALAEAMPWSRSWDDMAPYTKRSANGEVLAHLVQLERRGRAQRSDGRPFVWSLQPVAEAAIVGEATA